MAIVTYSDGNVLLDRLPKPEIDAMRGQLEVITLSPGEVLYPGSAERLLRYAYFPIDSVASMLVTMGDGSVAEAGTTGREGMVGAQSAFGSRRMFERWVAQVPGTAARMPVDDFYARFRALPSLRSTVQRYVQSYVAFLAQSVACTGLHPADQRCARRLLLTHDRVGRDEFVLTQEFLSLMIGGRRAGVSVAASTLQDAGLISYVCGRMTILNRAGLEKTACECYRVSTGEYARLFLEEPLTDEPEAVLRLSPELTRNQLLVS